LKSSSFRGIFQSFLKNIKYPSNILLKIDFIAKNNSIFRENIKCVFLAIKVVEIHIGEKINYVKD